MQLGEPRDKALDSVYTQKPLCIGEHKDKDLEALECFFICESDKQTRGLCYRAAQALGIEAPLALDEGVSHLRDF